MPLPRGKLSGLQRDVLGLYRGFLREARRRDQLGAALPGAPAAAQQAGGGAPGASGKQSAGKNLKEFVRGEFRRQADVDRKEYQLIEYLLRKGTKQLQQLRDSNTTGFHVAQRGDVHVAQRGDRGQPNQQGQ